MKVVFSKHAGMKIKERKIVKEYVEKVLRKPDFVFYDLLTRALVNIGKMQIGDIGTNLIVVYTKYGDTVKVITAYPCSDVLREIKKKEGKRWIRIR